MVKFYSNEKVLSTMDKNGNPPGVVITCSRTRALGKTFSYAGTLLELHQNDRMFGLLCRNVGQLGSVAEGILSVNLNVNNPTWTVYEKIKDCYSQIWLKKPEEDDIMIGYVLPIKNFMKIKLTSSTFYKIDVLYFDEFQPEDGRYLPNELKAIMSIAESIGRGGGHANRYVPIWLTSNTVSMSNPYFTAMRLHRFIQPDTKFYRGDGFVYERVESREIADIHNNSPLRRAFSGLDNYNDETKWIGDRKDGVIKKMKKEWGPQFFVGNLHINDVQCGLWYFPDVGILYVNYTIVKDAERNYRIGEDSSITLANLVRSLPGVGAVRHNGGLRFASTHLRNEFLDNL